MLPLSQNGVSCELLYNFNLFNQNPSIEYDYLIDLSYSCLKEDTLSFKDSCTPKICSPESIDLQKQSFFSEIQQISTTEATQNLLEENSLCKTLLQPEPSYNFQKNDFLEKINDAFLQKKKESILIDSKYASKCFPINSYFDSPIHRVHHLIYRFSEEQNHFLLSTARQTDSWKYIYTAFKARYCGSNYLPSYTSLRNHYRVLIGQK